MHGSMLVRWLCMRLRLRVTVRVRMRLHLLGHEDGRTHRGLERHHNGHSGTRTQRRLVRIVP